MVNIFLDANFFIDLRTERQDISVDILDGKNIFISTLTLHIFFYLFNDKLTLGYQDIIGEFLIVNFSEEIALKAFTGPTHDFEDNVQLHSAAEAECDYFLTQDKKLLKMQFFGKTKVVKNL